MALTAIPLPPSEPNIDLEVDLSGILYALSLRWNTRGSFWTLSIATIDGVTLLNGVRLVADYDLITQYPNPLLPAGSLVAVDTSGFGVDPGPDDLGVRVLLMYDDGEPDT